MTEPATTKWIYDFEEGSREMRDLLGGKGANVAEMTRVLGAELVPAGFTVTTQACVRHLRTGGTPEGLDAAVDDALARLEARVCGEHGGDPDSIRFFQAAGLDYVSCSPFRVPVARVAAAQAAGTTT